MISDLFTLLGCWSREFVLGMDLSKSEDIRLAREIRGRRAAKAVIGQPRLRKTHAPTADKWQAMTCKQLDAELRARGIRGRSKAKRKADKIALLRSAWI